MVARKSGKIGESDAKIDWHIKEKHDLAHPSTNFHDAFKNRVHSFKIESKRMKQISLQESAGGEWTRVVQGLFGTWQKSMILLTPAPL